MSIYFRVYIFFIGLVGIFLCSVILRAQEPPDGDEVFVKSWKRGEKKISQKTIDLKLSSTNRVFQTYLCSASESKYLLSVKYFPAGEVSVPFKTKLLERWKVELFELMSASRKTARLSQNLLKAEQSEGGVNLPGDDMVGWLYPKQDSNIEVFGRPLMDGNFFPPIYSTRRIRVEGFFLLIKVTELKISDIEPFKVDYLKVSITLENVP